MKQWIKKLLEQLEFDSGDGNTSHAADINEEKATILFILDTYAKHLYEIDTQSVRKVREQFDLFSKSLIKPDPGAEQDLLFKLRQFFLSYRIDESTYIQKTFDEFKTIIWAFADQLSDDIKFEEAEEEKLKSNLDNLKEAVEANSIEDLKKQSRGFIDSYVQYQSFKQERKQKKLKTTQKSLSTVRKKLAQAYHSVYTDHLTEIHNRRSFEEHTKNRIKSALLMTSEADKTAPLYLAICDIDFFKKVNDTYGHDIGDCIIKECARLLKECFPKEDQEFVARVGGEEFVIVANDMDKSVFLNRCQAFLDRVRKETFIDGDKQIKFTLSMGVAHFDTKETLDQFYKRADEALYASKKGGRDRMTQHELMSSLKAA